MRERMIYLIAATLLGLLLQASVAQAEGEPETPLPADTDSIAESEAQPADQQDALEKEEGEKSEKKPGFARWGPYLGLNAAYGMSVFNDPFKDLLSLPEVPLSSGNSPGLNTRVGLRFLKFIAIEAQYEWFRGFDLSLVSPFNLELGQLSNHTLTGNLKLFLPIWRVQPYVMGGIGASWWKAEGKVLQALLAEKGNGFAGRAGGGVELYLTRQIVLDIEATVVMFTKDFETRDFFGTPTTFDRFYYLSTSAGLSYRF